jgi:NAD(P)-dependent dehydrogenase (short-subunit alcohol dehydrogenase family)
MDVDEQAAYREADILKSSGGRCEAVGVDVTDSAAVTTAVQRVITLHGRLDYMINNAGINIVGDFRDLDDEAWRRIVAVNLWGVVYGTRAAYEVMLSQGFGHIVNISSGLGLTPGPGNVPYATTKSAIVGFSESLRIEARDLGIHVTVVCPGWIRTPMLEGHSVVARQTLHRTRSGSALQIIDAATNGMPFGLHDVERAAWTILHGVARGKAMVVFPAYVRYFWWLYRLCRPASDWWNRREIRRFRELVGYVE